MNDERRQTQRQYPMRLQALLCVADLEFEVRLIDESAEGLGVFLPDNIPIEVGQMVEVRLSDWEAADNRSFDSANPVRNATVCRVEPHALGGMLIGLAWLERDLQSPIAE